MKPPVVAGLVAVAFAGGVAVATLLGGREAGPTAARGPAGTQPAGPEAPRVVQRPGEPPAASTGPGAGPAGAATGAAGPGGAGGAPAATTAAATEVPPVIPAPPPGALAEGAAMSRELEARADGRGGGKVTRLMHEPEDELAVRDAERRRSWEDRLAREREIKLRALQEKVGITPAQAAQLEVILVEEARVRGDLVEQLTAGAIAPSTFDARVQENVKQARQQLARLLTPQQLQAYEELSPREQVLRDETK